MRAGALAIRLAALVTATAASAEAPSISPRPVPRPVVVQPAQQAPFDLAVDAAVISAALASSGLTNARLEVDAPDPVADLLQGVSGASPVLAVAGNSALAVARSPVPPARPGWLASPAEPSEAAQPASARVMPTAPIRAGSICGVAEIRGAAIAPIHGAGACGVAEPVQVSSVAGIPLSMQPTIDCPTAIALNTWVRDGVLPTIGTTGGGVAQINIIAHYSCRSRNNVPGAKLSEHSKGHAVDVSGVTLRNGTVLTVEEQWRGRYSNQFRTLYRRACGPFGTVLSPDADRYHHNHFHLDTARYRGGSYCH